MSQPDIYNRTRQLERVNERIIERISNAGNRKTIKEFETWLFSQGLSIARIVTYLDGTEWIALQLNGNSLKKIDEKATLNLLKTIQIQKWEEWTKYGKKTTLRKFFNFLHREDLVKLVKAIPPTKKKLPEDLMTKADIEKMIEVASHPRDKAFLALLYESGARISEIALITIKSVTFDGMGAVVMLANGKTGMRRIRVVYAASFLRQWIDSHPMKNNRDAPVWINLWAKKVYKPLHYLGFRKILVEAGEKAGINKHVYLHLARHSRATHLAEHMTEQQMKNYLGWTSGSNMASVYVHLSGKDLDNTVLKMYGMQKEENIVDIMKPGRCSRCKELNPKGALFCFKCGLPMNTEFAAKIEEGEAKMDIEYMELMIREPKLLDILKDYINRQKQ